MSKKEFSKRTTFSNYQLRILEEEFKKNKYPDGNEKLDLALKCKLSEKAVGIWFKNKRSLYKKLQNSNDSSSEYEMVDFSEFDKSSHIPLTSAIELWSSEYTQSSSNLELEQCLPNINRAKCQKVSVPQIREKYQSLYTGYGAPANPETFKPPAPSFKSFQDPSSVSQVYSQSQIYNLGRLWSHSPAVTATSGWNFQ